MLTKSSYNTFLESMLAHGFFLKITLPTRICDTSSTLMDQIYTNVLTLYDPGGGGFKSTPPPPLIFF